jgi:hypothetical protein
MRFVGVAQVIEANAMGTATALWGDIPFKQAASDEYPNPAYDAQSQVYGYIQALLDSAIQNLASTAFVDFSAQDIHFAGNNTKWIQTAWTLKARYFLQTKQYPQALAAAANGISTAANNWVAPHTAAGKGSYNLYYQFFVQDRPTWLTATNAFAVSLLNSANAKYRGNTKTIEKSRYNYLYSSATNPNYTTNGFYYQTVAFPLATYAENLLILAEAVILGFLGGGLGLALSSLAIKALPMVPMVGDAVRQFPNLGLSPQVGGLGFGVALFLGLAAGVVPALGAYRAKITDMLRTV